MKIALFSILIAATAFAQEHDGKVIPSPDKKLSIKHQWANDDPTGEAYTHLATLQRGNDTPWAFSDKGRAIVFSWSPDSRYLLFGVVLPGRDMDLYFLDTRAKQPKEQNLNLSKIERKVEASLPERASGAFASRSQIDFEKIQWTSASECKLRYFYQFDRKGGDAELTLDLAEKTPALKITKIIALAE